MCVNHDPNDNFSLMDPETWREISQIKSRTVQCYRFETVVRSRKTLSVTVRDRCQTVLPRMVYSAYKKQRILHFYSKGYKAPTIQKFLAGENLVCSRVGIAKFIKVFERTGSICRQPGSMERRMRQKSENRLANSENRSSCCQN